MLKGTRDGMGIIGGKICFYKWWKTKDNEINIGKMVYSLNPNLSSNIKIVLDELNKRIKDIKKK
jgi:hypothetical protein